MARDYINIGSAPAAEECAQVGSEDYYPRARRECTAFINQIKRQLGAEPGSALLSVKAFQHDFGTYHEVVCWYAEYDEEAYRYALRCESEMPEYWDEEARKELGL